MSENLPKLKIHMLGGFSIIYGEKPISFGRNTVTKATKLLLILLYRGEKGISREKLLEELYGREELSDVANNLRVTVHRMKKMLVEAGLPQYDYVHVKKGIYRWNAPMETEIDAKVFSGCVEQAKAASDKAEKIKWLKTACRMYGGDFLPDLSGDEWVLLESVRYKREYTDSLRELSDMLMENGEYEETLQLIAPACQMYPFDEWQAVRIDCYIAQNRFKEAMKEYEETAKLFFEELGINPSEKLMSQFELMSSRINHRPEEIKEIKMRLKETEDESGAYYCSLPSFRDNYRLIARIMERNGQSVYLMQCNITNGKGQPMENEKKLDVLSQELYDTIQMCLRKGDCFTKYSPSQFLILLVGTNKENCGMIFDRIMAYFSREHQSWGQYLEYVVSSVADVNKEDSPIQFKNKKDTGWSEAERKIGV